MKPNDKVRLRQYPNVVGTFVAYTLSMCGLGGRA
jgi:hypothetical protein